MKRKEIINTKNAPVAVGPYSQAVRVGEMVFTSGQLGINPLNNQLVEGIENQTRQALKNIENILEATNSLLDNAIKVTVFLRDMNNFSKMNEIYGEYFTKNPPARSCVEVSKLPKDAEIEIEVMATVYEKNE
ncbi:RidA family protein [Candidatus Atribacteria bacterium 1244-E10-H5-B2]|nr:MAG: RidA family protein [Candidatus Atribacteria bacterium 1244-E10-H5-B2]